MLYPASGPVSEKPTSQAVSESTLKPDLPTDSLTTHPIELDACVAVGIADTRIESIRCILTQN
jgi:hypothetical protein